MNNVTIQELRTLFLLGWNCILHDGKITIKKENGLAAGKQV